MQKLLLVLVLSLTTLSCAHKKAAAVEKEADPAAVEQVRKRAVVDLGCEDVKVDVLERGSMMRPWTFAVAGCGKTASYLSRMGTLIRN
jgi:hypothetical protein